jgi:hypothetical protein
MGTTSTLAEPTGLSSRVVGTCMIAAPVALLVGELLHPAAQHDAAAQLQVLGHNPARQYAAHRIFIVALILVVPALLGLANLLGARRAAWGQVGLGLGIAGTVAAFAGAELVTWQVGKAAEADAAAMTALLERLNTSAGFAPLLGLAFAIPVGFLVLGAGLHLARAVAPWQAVVVGGAPLVLLVAEFAYAPKAAIAVPALAFAVGLGSVGLGSVGLGSVGLGSVGLGSVGLGPR